MKDKPNRPFCEMHEALISYLYSEATSDEEVAVESHLKDCAACRNELEGFKLVRGMLQQWRTDDLPVLTVRTEAISERPFYRLLREWLTVSPLWLKSAAAVACVMLLLSVMGTRIQIGKDGLVLSFSMLVSDGGARERIQGSDSYDSRVRELVSSMIADSEQQQRADLVERLMKLEVALQGAHTSDLAKLAAKVREQRVKLEGLERDIDRREGLDITDLLFNASASGQGSEGQ